MSNYKGWTVSEAIENGLTAMHKTRDDVRVTVITTGKKGFLGIGKKQAEVKIKLDPKSKNKKRVTDGHQETSQNIQEKQTRKDRPKKNTSDEKDMVIRQLGYYLADITEQMGIKASISVDFESRNVVYNFNTKQEGTLIGKHGRILNALQVLAQNYLEQRNFAKLRLMLNVGEYREKRQKTLERLAQNVARDAIEQQKAVHLDAMPSFERKIIHASLAHDKQVKTYSHGREPRRYVIVEPVS